MAIFARDHPQRGR